MIRNEKGIAMMMALVTMLLLSILAAELVYETQVYNGIVFRQRDQFRAKLLARSGLRLGLLQLKAAKKAKEQAKNLGLGDSQKLTDEIWKTPLILPPPTPPGLGVAETQALEAFQKSLGLNGTISINILGESDRLSLNNLMWITNDLAKNTGLGGTGSSGGDTGGAGAGATGGTAVAAQITPEKAQEIRDKMKQSYIDLVNGLLDQKREADEEFRNSHSSTNGETLIGNLLAWMDEKIKDDGDNRDKKEYYQRVEPTPYAIKNAPLYSLSELSMIKGFDDTITGLFMETFTTGVSYGLNINKIPVSFIRALIPELGEEEAQRIIDRRQDETLGGPYKDENDFWSYVETIGRYDDAKNRLQSQGIKFLVDETSYRININIKSGDVFKNWVAHIGPMPPKIDQNTENKQAQPEVDITAPIPEDAATDSQDPNKKNTNKSDTETINVIYLKAD
ncbi:MAG: type II secretion system protein GspK [Oligoflexia bacterium]|nr:type II secretion system protein GspK [Oligoflexia bacterium]